jgi:hypothetical protein
LNGTYATTGSNTFTGIQTINSNLIVTGSITAQTLVVQTITSSVDFVTGSTRFGSILANTHVFSGSVSMNPGGLFVSSSGFVGIGTTTDAGYKLDVNGTGRFTQSNGAQIRLLNYGGSSAKIQGSSGTLAIDGNNATTLEVNSSEVLRATSTGNVGIGTSSPTRLLDVNGVIRTQNSGSAGAPSIELGTSAQGNGLFYPTTNTIAIATNDNERMRITSAGLVGIGTTTPTGSLDVSGSIYIRSSSGGVLYIPRLADPNHGLSIGEQNVIGSKSAVIRTGGGVSEYLFIDPGLNDSNVAGNIALASATTGSVGIGTYLPNDKLEVYGGNIRIRTTINGVNGLLSFTNTSGTVVSNIYNYNGLLSLNDQLTIANSGGAAIFSSTITATGATIASDVVGDPVYLRVRNNNTGGYPSSLALSIYGYSGTAAYFDALRIQASYPGYGSANFFVKYQSTSADVLALTLRGDGYMFSVPTYNNTWPGTSANMYISSDGSFGRITASSRRFKENINDWSGNGLDTILALKPKTFKYKKDYCNSPDNIDFLGLIAEEVAEVSPYLAQYENLDRTGLVENVRYDTIVVPLIKAVQELNTKLDAANVEIEALKSR